MTKNTLEKLKKLNNLFLFIFFIIFVLQLIGLFIIVLISPVCVEAQVTFTPQVTVPGSDFEQGAPYTEKGEGLLIAEYIQAWYKFAIAGVGILAVVMIMAGGLVWLTAGGRANQISTAKDWIMGAVIGLVLALMSYTLLDILNPNLVTFKSLKIDDLEGLDYLCCHEITGASYSDNPMCPYYAPDDTEKENPFWSELIEACSEEQVCVKDYKINKFVCAEKILCCYGDGGPTEISSADGKCQGEGLMLEVEKCSSEERCIKSAGKYKCQ